MAWLDLLWAFPEQKGKSVLADPQGRSHSSRGLSGSSRGGEDALLLPGPVTLGRSLPQAMLPP